MELRGSGKDPSPVKSKASIEESRKPLPEASTKAPRHVQGRRDEELPENEKSGMKAGTSA